MVSTLLIRNGCVLIVNLNKFKFITKLENNYDSNPFYCSHCGKPLTFKKFYKQFEFEKKFCCKKCASQYPEVEVNKFSSETEKTIYAFLSLTLPQYNIKHNITDIFPPYEIDMCIETEHFPVFLEFNGTLHYPRKNGYLTKSTVKHQINDKIKKIEICKNRQQKMIRLWSSSGLYSKPEIFEECLNLVLDSINYLIKANNDYGQCIDVVYTGKDIYRYKEKFKDDIIEEDLD